MRVVNTPQGKVIVDESAQIKKGDGFLDSIGDILRCVSTPLKTSFD